MRPNNSVYATADAPSAAKLKSRFALDCFKRNQMNRLIAPMVRHAAADEDQSNVSMLKTVSISQLITYQKYAKIIMDKISYKFK